ncbi:MAG: serine/threonine protein kinase [Treponema sp.]|nr:serine/threonine protein kinase [Treponema sp.]
MSDAFPAMIGKYKVLGIIAKGGMGVVYKAIHPSLKRYVVIKKMTARGHAGDAGRFKKEAQLLLDLQSPYIVHLFDYFTEGGFRYMVEELVDGTALDALIKKQTALPCPIAMLLMQDACYALKYAHSKEIVHRDIKPGNILLSKRGEIKLADFGIASDHSTEQEVNGGSNLTQTGIALGTPAYMPPEQFEDSARVDHRADIYALGIMLYEMVTGTKPYPGTLSLETLAVIKKGRYIDPRKLDKTVPKDICRLIHKMIRPKAKARFQSIEAVLRQVKKYLRHYDTHELRVQLAKAVINPKTYEFAQDSLTQKDKARRLVRRISVAICAISVVFCGLWYSGLLHKTLLAKWYSEVSVQMEMPRALSESLDLPVRAFFFQSDGDKVPELRAARRTFNEQGKAFYEKIMFFSKRLIVSRPAGRTKTYTVRPVYLKKGNYRVKVVVGPYVWWKSFSITGGTSQIISCDFLKGANRKLNILCFASDSKTGKNITSQVDFSVFYKNKWRLISELSENELSSAAVWKIKAESPNYKTEEFSLLIDWYQDNLIIEAALSPLQEN